MNNALLALQYIKWLVMYLLQNYFVIRPTRILDIITLFGSVLFFTYADPCGSDLITDPILLPIRIRNQILILHKLTYLTY